MTGDGLGQGLSDMWRSVLVFVPTAVAFVVIVAVGYGVARLLRAAVGKGLRKAGFDRVVERGAAGRMVRAAGVAASDVCAKLVFCGVLLFAFQVAFGLWGDNPVSDLLSRLIAWLPHALIGIVIVVVAAAVAGKAHDVVAGALGGLGYGLVLAKVVSAVILALGVIAALDQVRIATSVTRPLLVAVLATIAGVVIVGVGGGLVRPMQKRWDGWLDRAGVEGSAMREQATAYRKWVEKSDETQVIRPRGAGGDGGGEEAGADEEEDGERTTVIRHGAGDTTILNPSPDETLVIGSEAERTQVIFMRKGEDRT